MCLITFAWRAHPDYRLILAANRDELHARPAAPLQWWADAPDVLGGRDLQAGGTWLALSRSGRFATVTNYRENLKPPAGFRSRGELVSRFVTGDEAPQHFANALDGASYAGFSLLAATLSPDYAAFVYGSNRGDPPRLLPAGVYGLSNASLDTPWHKLSLSKARLRALLAAGTVTAEALFELLADRLPAPEGSAEDLGELPPPVARAGTAPFIVTPDYGTRCSTVVVIGAQGRAEVYERRFDSAGEPAGESRVEFEIASGIE